MVVHNAFARGAVLALALAALAPALASAQVCTGEATGIAATVASAAVVLADTGTLTSTADELGSSITSAAVGGLGTAENLECTTGSTVSDVSSAASLGNLVLGIAGETVTAAFVMAESEAQSSGATNGGAVIQSLVVGGVPVDISGAPNQEVDVGALKVIIDEVTDTDEGHVVSALHIKTLDDLDDIFVARAKARFSASGSASGGTSGGGSLGGGLLGGGGITLGGL